MALLPQGKPPAISATAPRGGPPSRPRLFPRARVGVAHLLRWQRGLGQILPLSRASPFVCKSSECPAFKKCHFPASLAARVVSGTQFWLVRYRTKSLRRTALQEKKAFPPLCLLAWKVDLWLERQQPHWNKEATCTGAKDMPRGKDRAWGLASTAQPCTCVETWSSIS